MGKTCIAPSGCSFPVWGKKYCERHQYLREDLQAKKKAAYAKQREQPKQQLKRSAKPKMYSKKRTLINRHLYSPRMRAFIKERPFCEIRIEGVCTKESQGVHHLKGKATTELLLDERFWMAACNACNSWVEGNSKKAVELGLKIPEYASKLSKFKEG